MQYALALALAITMEVVVSSGCSSPTVQAATDQQAVAVNAVVAELATLRQTTTQPATVHAYHTANIYAKVSGYIEKVHVDIGDKVKRNDVLAVIEMPELEKQLAVTDARIARYQAQETGAAAGLELAKAGRQNAEAGIAEARSQIAAAEARLKAAESEHRRTEEMVSRQVVQEKLFDESLERRAAAQADLDAARATLRKAKSSVNVAKASVASAEASVKAASADTEVAKAEREEIQEMLKYATLRAPFNGVVTQRNLDPGDLVRSNGETGGAFDPHFVVMQIDKVRVRTIVPEFNSPLVDAGDPVRIVLTSADLSAVEGQVTRTSKSLDPDTRTMTVEIEVSNPEGKLLPGMYGEATITLVEKPDVVVLPASAVRFDATGKSFVYVIDSSNTVHAVDVSIGYDDGERIEIVSDLSAGQRVIDAHLKRFKNGDAVRVLD